MNERMVRLTKISLDLRVLFEPSILTATTTEPDPSDLKTTRRVNDKEHSLERKDGAFKN